MRIREFFRTVIAASLLGATASHSGSAAPEALSPSFVKNVTSVSCAFLKSKPTSPRVWLPSVKVGKKYVSAKERLRTKGLPAKQITKLRKLSKSRVCDSLVAATSLGSLPGAKNFLTSTSASTSSQVVSGTPPTLSAILALSPTARIPFFWQTETVTAVASGAPTTTQCTEFVTGTSDGTPAGLVGCFSAQDTIRGLQQIELASGGACRVGLFSSSASLSTGLVSVTSGTLPSGGITSLFDAPTGTTPRLIKFTFGTSSYYYVRVYPDTTNLSRSEQYRYDLWDCGLPLPGQTTSSLHAATTGAVSSDGRLNLVSQLPGLAANGRFEIAGQLRRTSDGSISFDSDSERTFTVQSIAPGTLSFKTLITLSSGASLTSKTYIDFQGELRRSLATALFSGDSFSALGLSAFAVKELKTVSSTTTPYATGIEFRDTRYVSAPASSLVASLSSVDIASDTFLASAPEVTLSVSDFSCTAVPDVELTVDITSALLPSALMGACPASSLVGNLCDIGEVSQAKVRYPSVCSS